MGLLNTESFYSNYGKNILGTQVAGIHLVVGVCFIQVHYYATIIPGFLQIFRHICQHEFDVPESRCAG